MALDNTTHASVTDSAANAAAAPDLNSALAHLQEGAGLQDKVGSAKGSDGLDQAIKRLVEGNKGDGETIKIWDQHLKPEAPTDKERSDAEKTLEGRMSKLIPDADRESMKAMTTALTNGDTKAFGEAVKKCGGDPAKLKALVTEVDKMLEEKGSSTRLDVTADGKVLVSEAGQSTALAFDPKSGNVEAKSVEQNMDGSVLVKPGELLHVDPDKAFKEMGDAAVNAVNGKLDFNVEKPISIDPMEPFHPHTPLFPPGDKPLRPWDDGLGKIELYDSGKATKLGTD